jgi:hypothetical protein
MLAVAFKQGLHVPEVIRIKSKDIRGGFLAVNRLKGSPAENSAARAAPGSTALRSRPTRGTGSPDTLEFKFIQVASVNGVSMNPETASLRLSVLNPKTYVVAFSR